MNAWTRLLAAADQRREQPADTGPFGSRRRAGGGSFDAPAPRGVPRPDPPPPVMSRGRDDPARLRELERQAAESAAESHRRDTEFQRAVTDPQSYPDGMLERHFRRRAAEQEKLDTNVAEAGRRKWWTEPQTSKLQVNEMPFRRAAAREMDADAYDALTERQQAAVQFNTGLLAARDADAESGGDAATRGFLSELGVRTRTDEELNSFLQLDRMISQTIIDKLEDPTARRQSAESLRLSRGEAEGAPQAQQLADAQSMAALTADLLARRLGTTGRALGQGGDPLPGFGSGPRDQVIQRAYTYMIDPQFDFTPDDIAQGVADLNAQMGTDVTPQEVWDFLRANLEAARFGRQGDTAGTLPAPVNPETGVAEFTPLDIAEIRRRYGL